MKKGSLSLSVNAIVIFVIAFAMLGFGLYVIDLIRDQVDDKIPGIFDTDSWNPPPDSLNPIEVKGSLTFQKGKTKVIGIGVYNEGGDKEMIPANKFDCGAKLASDPSGTTAGNRVLMETVAQNVDTSSWKPFEVKVDVEDGAEAGTYICNLNIYGTSPADHQQDATDTVATKQVSIIIEG